MGSPSRPRRIDGPTILFVSFRSLRAGTGTEVAIYNYISRAPEPARDKIFLVQSDALDVPRLSDSAVATLLPATNVTTIHGAMPSEAFQSVGRSRLASQAFYGLLAPIWLRLSGLGRRLRDASAVINPDIVYLTANDLAPFFKRPGTIVVGSEHGWRPRQNQGRFARLQLRLLNLGLLFRSVDAFHVFPGSDIPRSLPDTKASFVLPNGVDAVMYHPPIGEERQGRSFLYVARLEKCKGVDVLLDVWERYASELKGSRLTIIGVGALAGRIRRTSTAGVTYLGPADGDEVARAHRRSSVFLYPSRCDSFPFVILQALASGEYVVASDSLKGVFDEFQEIHALEYCSPDAKSFGRRVLELREQVVPSGPARAASLDLIRTKYEAGAVSRLLFARLAALATATELAAPPEVARGGEPGTSRYRRGP